ncbi:glycosyltransferase [Christiangramia sabulilitoris]|uniref:Glycosyltransferase n=1 Tax=Christiangramia sabulilitoris TaxID=2583991 RepID=A0A550I009_9FLAO|nr:glycosyltransferase [Christiangramia sabulilitoris]TRO64270.1 glycosyltransferase [Christiangramia sabulilitoris]
MKIIHVVPYIGEEASGPAYSVPRLCEALAKQDCDIVLYTLGPLPKRKFYFKVKSFSRGVFPHPSFGFSWKMYKSLLEDAKDADIIHNHSLWMAPNIFAGIVASKKNIPFINAPRGTLSKKALSRSNLTKKIALLLGQRKALIATDCFHATAAHEADDIREYQPSTPISIIPNGIDIPKDNSFRPKEKTVLYFGRIHPIKGIENLIQAWKKVNSNHPEWNLKIVGKGDLNYINSLKEIIKENDVQNVYLLGPVYGKSKNSLYQEARLYVLPSYSENFGMTVAEALANGVPVITTIGTPWKNLNKNKCGWCVEPTSEALSNTLVKALCLKDEELQQIGLNGKKWMQQEYSWEEISKNMMKTYDWMIQKNEKPSFINE